MKTATTEYADIFLKAPPGLPRLVDVFCAALVLVFSSPLLAFCAVAIAVDSRGPVFFRQVRMGRGGQRFQMVKFRTMRVAQGGPQITADGDARITRVGRVLRAAKIDEIPALWNVLRGEMSIVGPRPEVPRYIDLGDPRWQRVLSARPGITDPVSVRLRNEQAILAAVPGDREEFYTKVLVPYKLRGYTDYLAKRSWHTDVGVLKDTFRAVVFPESVPSPRLN